MNKKGLAVALAAIATTVAVPAGAGADGKPKQSDYERTLARYATQPVDWAACLSGGAFPEFECAEMIVPIDWAKPGNGEFTVAISRVLSSEPGQRRGIMLSNPGGPGGSGLILPLFFSVVEPEVSAVYDQYGFDPRGVPFSTEFVCADPTIFEEAYGIDGRASSENRQRLADLANEFAQQCAQAPLTRYINTDQTVRDMDLIRAIAGEPKISYVGYSAGTWMGAWYAERFPDRVDRFVLDGLVDFTGTWSESFQRQPAAFQRSFEDDFLEWVADNDATYGLGDDDDDVEEVYEERRAALAAQPMTMIDGSLLRAADYDSGIAGSLYATFLYPDLATAMVIIENFDSATPEDKAFVLEVFPTTSSPLDPTDNVFLTVVCSDTKNPSPRTAAKNARKLEEKYPLLGHSWLFDPCPYWPLKPVGSPVNGKKLPPMLFINNDGDPATPLESAERARKKSPNSVLLTVEDQGDHTIYAAGLPCVEDIANDWLVNGVLPDDDVECQGFPLPDAAYTGGQPTVSAPSAGTDPRLENTKAQLWIEQFREEHPELAD